MKKRNGFVSNSSTSSFVIVGVKLDELGKKLENLDWDSEEYEEILEELEEKVDYILHGEDDGVDGLVVGFVVTEIDSDDYLKDGTMEFSELQEKVERLAKNFSVNAKDVKIYYGTRSC